MEKKESPVDRVDISNFEFALNPDVYSGQKPETEEEKAQMEKDEADVRAACTFLLEKVIPRLVCDCGLNKRIIELTSVLD